MKSRRQYFVPGVVISMMALVFAGFACAAETEIVEVEKIVTEIVEKEVIKEIPKEIVVESIKEVVREVPKEVVVETVKEVVREVPVEKIVEKVVTEVIEVEKEVVKTKEVVVVATPTPTDDKFYMKTLDAFPKRGGTLYLGAHGPPAMFDIYASVTIANAGSMTTMYDQLIRRDPRTSTVPIIPDLAYAWEISPDGTVYTFHIRDGVKFHDGTDLTSADIKATYDRIVFPKEGLVSNRQVFLKDVSKIAAPDDHTVVFTLGRPKGTDVTLAAFASEWNHINAKATLDKHDGNLRKVDNQPGTGAYVYKSRDDDKWVQEANPNYWNENAPYVDRLEHIWFRAWTPENTAALIGGRTDWTMWLAPKDGRNIGDNPGISQGRMHSFTVAGMNFNTAKEGDVGKFLSDKKVRRAMMLAMDAPVIVDMLKDINGLMWGGFFVAGTPYALTQSELQSVPGLRSPNAEDMAEARQLLADAGYPEGAGSPTLDLITRETPDQRLMMPAVQAMMAGIGISSEIRIADASGYIEDMQFGKFDIGFSASKSLAGDPGDYFKNMYGICEGDAATGKLCDNNHSMWRHQGFNDLLNKLDAEVDMATRLAYAADLRTILLDEAPLAPTMNSEVVYWGWSDNLKGMMPDDSDFYTWYELHKWDNVCLNR